MLEQVRSIFEIVGLYLNTTLEQFEITLMQDAASEDEVIIWASITALSVCLHPKYPPTVPASTSIAFRTSARNFGSPAPNSSALLLMACTATWNPTSRNVAASN
jgi:hypothetical protein